MALRQFLGNLTDRAGTLSANIGGPVGSFLSKERGISEKLAGNRPTVNTGTTQQSRQAGFTPYTPANMSNRSTGLSVRAPKAPAQTTSGPIGPRLPGGGFTGPMPKQTVNAPAMDISGGGMSQAEQEAQQRAEEERRLIAERERENEEFRGKLGTQYGETRTRFNELLGGFNEKLKTLPEQLRQLGQQYKAAIGEQQTQKMGQLGQRREQVAMQQKEGLAKIAEQLGQRVRQGAGRLGSLGMASSAAGMFQRAIQNEANKSAKDLLTQAANNYQELDAEENRIRSAYKTMIDEADARENQNIQDIQRNVNTIIEEINQNLKESGEYETLDKKDLTNKYLQELTNRFQIAKQNSESYKQQLEQARRENESAIRNLKNQLVQDFIPKEIQPRELTGVRQTREQEAGMEQGLSPKLLRRVPEDNEEIGTPQGLQAITRRLRQNINQ